MGCDDIMCLIDASRCCPERDESPAARAIDAAVAPTPRAGLPASVTRAQITGRMRGVTEPVRACASQHGFQGVLEVRLRVRADGSVTATVEGGSAALGRCVRAAVEGATFPRSQRGATAVYPFIVR